MKIYEPELNQRKAWDLGHGLLKGYLDLDLEIMDANGKACTHGYDSLPLIGISSTFD